MIRVISSPSSSTIGFLTLIFGTGGGDAIGGLPLLGAHRPDASFGVAQAGGEAFEQRPGDLAVLGHIGLEVPGGHSAAMEVGGGDDRCRARAAVDQGYLAEVLARAEGANPLSST